MPSRGKSVLTHFASGPLKGLPRPPLNATWPDGLPLHKVPHSRSRENTSRKKFIYLGLLIGIVANLMLQVFGDVIAEFLGVSGSALTWGVVLVCVVTIATLLGVARQEFRQEYVERLIEVRKQLKEQIGDDDASTPT